MKVENNFDKKISELIIDEVLKKIQEFDTDKSFKCTTKPSELKEFDEKEEAFLLTCALYHDIGKLFIKARHGQEGADIIKDIGDDEVILFNNLNIDAGI